jgi:hypothetical protein
MDCQVVAQEELAEKYVSGRLDQGLHDELEIHILECPECAALLEMYEETRAELVARQEKVRRISSRGAWRIGRRSALAACALITLAVGIRLAWEWQHKSKTVVHKPTATPPPKAEATNKLAERLDTVQIENVPITDAPTEFAEQGTVPPSVVASVVASQHLQVPRGFADLAVRRGPNEGPFPLISPVGTVVSSTKPMFTWRPVPDAQGYKVQISDSQQNLVGTSPVLTHTSWKSTVVLRRGTTYVWRIVIIAGGVEYEQPPLDVPQGRFQVLSAYDFRQIQALKHDAIPVHFYLGIWLAHAGVLEEAVEEFRVVPPSDPNHKLAKKFESEAQGLIVHQQQGSAQ